MTAFAFMGVTKSRADAASDTMKKNDVTVLYLQGAWIGRRFVCVGLKPAWIPPPPKPISDHEDLTLTIPIGHGLRNACLGFGASVTRRARDRDDFFEHVKSIDGEVHIAHAFDHRAVCGYVESWSERCVVEEDVSCAKCSSKAKDSSVKMYRARHAFA